MLSLRVIGTIGWLGVFEEIKRARNAAPYAYKRPVLYILGMEVD